jgi:hypothetical protein
LSFGVLVTLHNDLQHNHKSYMTLGECLPLGDVIAQLSDFFLLLLFDGSVGGGDQHCYISHYVD